MDTLKPKQHPKVVGQQAEAMIIAKLLEVGYNILIPYLGENLRYDLLVEDADGKYWRVQCKTGRVESNHEVIDFNSASNYYHHRKEGTTWGRKAYYGVLNVCNFIIVILKKRSSPYQNGYGMVYR